MKRQRALKTLFVPRMWGNRRAGLFPVCILTAALALPAAAQTPSFQGLGQMPGAVFGTYASAISADGSMVAGADNWWKTSGQTGSFGPFPGQQNQTEAFGLSPDGQVAVGAAIKGSDPFGPTFHAFRWTPSGGLQDLGLTTGTQTSANAISANGLEIAGQATDSNGFWRAFRWTASTGMQDIGTLGGPMSNATAVNMDSTVIVGNSLTPSSSGSSHAFRWTAQTGMQGLKTALQTAG